MKILVTVKRVPDPYAKVAPLRDGTGLDTEGIKFEINPFDEIAVEEAVRLRERLGSVEIVVVSVGDSKSEEQLRKALAMGADRAILVELDEEIDSPRVTRELESVVREQQPDLILMGKQATDDDNNQVAQMLAARLGWPQATFAREIVITGNVAKVTRETDLGHEVLELDLPAVVTADLRLNEPRYIALPGIIKARSKPLERRPPSATSLRKSKVTRYELPPARPSGRIVASVTDLVEAIRERGAI